VADVLHGDVNGCPDRRHRRSEVLLADTDLPQRREEERSDLHTRWREDMPTAAVRPRFAPLEAVGG